MDPDGVSHSASLAPSFTRLYPAGTKPSVYNQGFKHFCTQKIPAMTSNTKTEALTRKSNFSFTTRPKTQEDPLAGGHPRRNIPHEGRDPPAGEVGRPCYS